MKARRKIDSITTNRIVSNDKARGEKARRQEQQANDAKQQQTEADRCPRLAQAIEALRRVDGCRRGQVANVRAGIVAHDLDAAARGEWSGFPAWRSSRSTRGAERAPPRPGPSCAAAWQRAAWPGADCLPCSCSLMPRDCSSPAFSGISVFSAAWRLVTSARFFSSRRCTSGGGGTLSRPAKPSGSYQALRGEAVAVVHRPGRRVLAGDGIAGIQAPQAAILADPGTLRIHQDGDPSCGSGRARWPCRPRARSPRRECETDPPARWPRVWVQKVFQTLAQACQARRADRDRPPPGTRPSESRRRASRRRHTPRDVHPPGPTGRHRPSGGADRRHGSRARRRPPIPARAGRRPRRGRPRSSPNRIRGRSRRRSPSASCCSNRRTSTGARSSGSGEPRGRSR